MQQKRKEGSGPKRTRQGLEGWTSELGALPHAASTPKATVATVPVHLLPSVKLYNGNKPPPGEACWFSKENHWMRLNLKFRVNGK